MDVLDRRLDEALKRHRGGDLAAAMAGYRGVLAEAPEHAEALHLLGVATLQSGDARAARELIGRAIATAPEVAKYHVNLGEAQRVLGDLEGALDGYRRALALDPGNAAARNNLGAVLLRLRRDREACEALEESVRRAPQDAQALANLGQARWRLGAVLPALEALANAVLLAPQNLSYRQLLVRVAREMPSPELPPQVWKQLLDCFGVQGIDLQPLVRPILAIARRTPEFRAVVELTEGSLEAAREGLDAGVGSELLNSVLLSDLLFQTLIADPTIEQMLIRLRRVLLIEAADQTRGGDQGVLGEQPLFAAGLAAQAHANGYLWPVDAEERVLVDRLAAQLAQDTILGRLTIGDRAALQRFLVVAAYRPLAGPGAEALGGVAGVIELAADRFAPRLRQLVRRQITATRQEAELAHSLQRAKEGAEIDEMPGVSGARWQNLDKRPPVPLAERIAPLFPALGLRPAEPRVLVAGCGMGKHAVELAAQLGDAPVVAMDRRRADLAYARRMAREQGVANIGFRLGQPADLVGAGRFALIEAAGAEAIADLAALLAPGGLLKLILSSPRRAAAIAAAQADVAAAGLGPADLAAARRLLLALAPGHPAREVTVWDGFYARPTAEALLFGPIPAAFDLAAARTLVAGAGLDWLGLQREDRIVEDVAEADLSLQVWAINRNAG